MKIKMSTLIYLFSVVVLLINMRYGEIFPFIPSLGNVFDVLLIVGLFLVCRLLRPINGKIHKYTRFLDLFVFSMFCLWVLELVLTVMSGRNSFVNAFSDFCQWHLKILFVYPLIYLFDYYGSAKMLKRLFSMQSIYVLTQALVAAVYNLTGRMLIPEMIRSETWLRNGNIRMTASALGCLAIVYFFSGFLSMRGGGWRRRSSYLIKTIVLFFCMFFVNAGRSQYFAVAVALGMMYMVHRRSSVKQIGAVLLLCVGTYIALNSSVIASIMEGISADVVDGTISYRVEYLEKLLHAYGYSIMGMGYVGPSVPFGMHSFNFIDYGLLGDVLQFGIVSLYFYTMILCRGISAIRSSKDEYSRLFLTGFVWFFIASIVGFTVISGKRIIFVPVILAYMEYAYRCAKEGILPDAKEGLPIVKFVIRY